MLGQLPCAWWVLVVLGVCAGVLSGTLGLGAGTILVPVLGLALGFEQKSAQGMALAVMVPMAFLGALRYWQNPEIEVDLAVVALVALGALAGTLIGTELAAHIKGQHLRQVFAVVLVIIGGRMFWSSYRADRAADGGQSRNQITADSVGNGDVNNGSRQQ